MSEEEIINKVQEIIEYSKLSIDIGFVDQTDKVNAIEGLLDLYNQEKEKNKKWEDKIKAKIEILGKYKQNIKPNTLDTAYKKAYCDGGIDSLQELLEEKEI